MAKDSSTASSGGIGFFGLLTIVFITLRLTHVIDWRWMWVLAPAWMPLATVLGICVVVGMVALGVLVTERTTRSWK